MLDLAAVKLSNPRRVVGGQNQDVLLQMDFVAFKSPVAADAKTIRMQRWDTLV